MLMKEGERDGGMWPSVSVWRTYLFMCDLSCTIRLLRSYRILFCHSLALSISLTFTCSNDVCYAHQKAPSLQALVGLGVVASPTHKYVFTCYRDNLFQVCFSL